MQVRMHVRHAVVYMDDAAAECLHWFYGFDKFLQFGAITIENFSPFVKTDCNVKNAVFIILSPIVGETLRTLMVIIRAHSFKNCVVITSLPPIFHMDAESPEETDFAFLENKILNWMGSVNYNASVEHIPLFSALLANNLLVLSSFSKEFSVFNCGLLEMNRRRTADFNIKNLLPDMQLNVKKIAYCLDTILDKFQVKGDVFSIGALSHIVGFELASLSHQQKKPHNRKVSIVIIDRLLDLAGPLSQSYETMLDQVLKTFPHLPGHVFDVGIPMNDLAECENETVFGRPLLAPGCLAHKNSPEELTAYYAVLEKRPRDALIELNRLIVESAANEEMNTDLNERLTFEVLKKRILLFKNKPELISKYRGLLQIALGVALALEHMTKSSLDQLSATEKALIQYLTVSVEEVLNNIMQMVTEREDSNRKMEEILIFLAFIYMLSGCSNIENEAAMQATLMETFFQEDLNDFLSFMVDGELEDENILNAVRTFFDVLKRLGTVRKGLKKYKSIFKSTNPAFPSSYDPLLKQLLDDIFDPSITDIPDLEFHSGSLKDYIKTGFSLFMNVSKPQPCDNRDLLLVVLGGLTPAEIKFIRDKETQLKDRQIYVCCTQVITPSDVLQDLGSVVKKLLQETSNDEVKQ